VTMTNMLPSHGDGDEGDGYSEHVGIDTPGSRELGDAEDNVAFLVTFNNVDYDRVSAEHRVRGEVGAAVSAVVASRESGVGIVPDMVELRGASGQTHVQFLVTLPKGNSMSAVQSLLNAATHLAHSLTARVNEVDGIGTVGTGKVRVCRISYATYSPMVWFQGMWKRDDNIYKIKGDTVRFPSGGKTNIRVTGPGAFKIIHPSGVLFEATLEEDGSRLKWSNGSVWLRAADPVLKARPPPPPEAAPPPPAPEKSEQPDVKLEVASAAQPQAAGGATVWPERWGLTVDQCQALLQRIRAGDFSTEAWKRGSSMDTLISDIVIPRTSGRGMGYALAENHSTPQEVNVLVLYAGSGNAEELLEAIVRSTSKNDVLFISAFSLYQAEDGCGPSVSQQLGPKPSEGPFQRILQHIQTRGKAAGWRWRWRGLLTALPAMLLATALVIFYAPVIAWGCVPTLDMARCAARAPPELGWLDSPGWHWLPEFERDLEGARLAWLWLPVAASFAVAAAVVRAVQHKYPTYDGRVLVVPSREVDVSRGLWCDSHVYVARLLGVPVVTAKALVSAGPCSSQDALCAEPGDVDRLHEDIEEKFGGSQELAFTMVDRAVDAVAQRHSRAQRAAVLRWALALALLRCADIRLAAPEDWRAHVPAYAFLGAALGTVAGAFAVYRVAWVAQGTPTPRALCTCAGMLVGASALAAVLLALFGGVRPAPLHHWTAAVDLLTDEAYRHQSCSLLKCRRLVAMWASFGQTVLVIGLSIAACVFGALCCPLRPRRAGGAPAVAAAWPLCAVLAAVVLARALCSAALADTGSEAEHLFAITVFYATSAGSRCVAPLSALLAGASGWGVKVADPRS